MTICSLVRSPQYSNPKPKGRSQCTGKGVLCLLFATRRRVQCYSDAYPPLLPLNTISKLKKKPKSPSLRDTVLPPTPPKATSCGRRGAPAFPAFERNPTSCPFRLCTSESAASGPDRTLGSECQLDPPDRGCQNPQFQPPRRLREAEGGRHGSPVPSSGSSPAGPTLPAHVWTPGFRGNSQKWLLKGAAGRTALPLPRM